ncbi:hypothetical protein JOM56_009418 [Amanita muscaria]
MGDRDLERRRHGLTEVEGDLERRRCRLAEVTTCLSKMSQTIEPREKAKRTKHGDAYFENERAGDGKKEHDRRSTSQKELLTGEERQSYFAEKRQESRQVVSILDINQ